MGSTDHGARGCVGDDIDRSVIVVSHLVSAIAVAIAYTIDDRGITAPAAREDAVAAVSLLSLLCTHMSSMRMMDLAGQSRKSLLSLASSILHVSLACVAHSMVGAPSLRWVDHVDVEAELARDGRGCRLARD